MALSTKSDYIYAIPGSAAPEFTGTDLIPAQGENIKYETMCHLLEQTRELECLLDVAAGYSVSSSTSVDWPMRLLGRFVGRCKALWESSATEGMTTGRIPKYGGSSGTWDDLAQVAPSVIAGIKTEADLKALFPSSPDFPAQTYDQTTHDSSLQPYKRAYDGYMYESYADLSVTSFSDLVWAAVHLVYAIEGSGLRGVSMGRRDPGHLFPSGIPQWFATLFSAGPYMFYFSMIQPFRSELPNDAVNVGDLFWGDAVWYSDPRKAHYIDPTAPLSLADFNIHGSKATFQQDSTSEDAAHPLVLLGTSRGNSAAVLTSLGSVLDHLYPNRNAASVSSGVSDKIGTAQVIASVTERYFPFLGSMSTSVQTPGGDLAGRVFGDSRVTPDAIIYADNLLAKCRRILNVGGCFLTLPRGVAIDIDGNETDVVTGSELLDIRSYATYSKELEYTGTPDNVELPNGPSWNAEIGNYEQTYITEKEGVLGDCSWSIDDYDSPNRDLTVLDGLAATIHLGSSPSLMGDLGCGVFSPTCKVALTISAHVDSGCVYVKHGDTRVYETYSVPSPDPDYPGTFYRFTSVVYDALNPSDPSLSPVTTTDSSRMRDVSTSFVAWFDGRVVVDGETGDVSVEIDIPSPAGLIAMANQRCGFGGDPFSVTNAYLLHRGSVRQDMEDAEAGPDSELQDAVDEVYAGLRSPFTYDYVVQGAGISGNATVTTHFNLTISVNRNSAGPIIMEVNPRSGTLANP